MNPLHVTNTAKAVLVAVFVSGCALGSAVAQVINMETIYQKTCAHCHGQKGEGVAEKKAPPLNTMRLNELSFELFNLTATTQSSGSDHEIMEHNQRRIEEKGLRYHPDDMARYIYTTFNPAGMLEARGFRAYSTEEIYADMCAKCHGDRAQGNPDKKGPPLNTYALHELEMELLSLREGFQSSGGHHEVMADTLKRIENRGMAYHPKDMATYIYFHFNAKATR